MQLAQYKERLSKWHNKPYLSTILKKKNTKRCETKAPEGTMAWKAVMFGGLCWALDQDPLSA